MGSLQTIERGLGALQGETSSFRDEMVGRLTRLAVAELSDVTCASFRNLHNLPTNSGSASEIQQRVSCQDGRPHRVTCGRRLGKSFVTDADLGGCGHVSGLLVRR